MSVMNGTIEGISLKFDKFSVVIDGKWYNTKQEYADEWPVKPVVGDMIQFDNGGKNYLGKLKILGSAGPGAAPSSSGPSKGGYSNLGVELGHAANLGMQIALGAVEKENIGTTSFYKLWSDHTDKVYAIMKGKRAQYEAGEAPVLSSNKEPVAKAAPVVAETEPDIFA